MQVKQYTRSPDGSPMALKALVLTDYNGGLQLPSQPTGPDGSILDTEAVLLLNPDGTALATSLASSQLSYSTRASLGAAISPASGQRAVVSGVSGDEFFHFVTGNQSANVTADPTHRTWVPLASDNITPGLNGAWQLYFSAINERQTLADLAEKLRANVAAKILLIGDSTVLGTDGATGATCATPLPAALQASLRSFFNNTTVTVVNLGVSGSTALQTLEGTGVNAGMTFEQTLAANPTADAVIMLFGTNDADGVSATTGAVYRPAREQMIDLCRIYGMVPIVATPFASTNEVLPSGTIQRAHRTRAFAHLTRKIAAAKSATLIDLYRYCELLYSSGKYAPVSLVPDGVHPTQALYLLAANFCIPALIGEIQPTNLRQRFAVPVTGNFVAGNGVISKSTSSRFQVNACTGLAGGDSLSMIIQIDEGGLDLWMAYPIWSFGATGAFNVKLNGVTVAPISQYNANYSAQLVQDSAVKLASNVAPGVHFVTMTAPDHAIGLNYLFVTPRSPVSDIPYFNSANGSIIQHSAAVPDFEFTTVTSTDQTYIFDKVPTSRLTEVLDLEFTANFAGLNEGMFVCGQRYGSPTGGVNERWGILVHLTTSGYLALGESTGPTTQNVTTVGAVNLQGVSHVYRLKIIPHTDGSAPDTAQLYVDDAPVGSPVTLTTNLYGGYLGVWRQSPGTTAYTNIRQRF